MINAATRNAFKQLNADVDGYSAWIRCARREIDEISAMNKSRARQAGTIDADYDTRSGAAAVATPLVRPVKSKRGINLGRRREDWVLTLKRRRETLQELKEKAKKKMGLLGTVEGWLGSTDGTGVLGREGGLREGSEEYVIRTEVEGRGEEDNALGGKSEGSDDDEMRERS